MESQFVIDSAGTSGWHVGETSDKRMQKHAVKRGYSLDSVSRQFDPDVDFDRFDIIIGMDDENIIALKRMARDMDDLKKIHKMTDFSKEWNYSEVPDPYYGGDEGFELVLDLSADACSGLLDSLTQNDIKN